MGLFIYTLVLVTLLAILWKISSVARYYIKYTIFAVTSVTITTVLIPLMMLKPRDSNNGLIPAKVILTAMRFAGLTVSLEGHENIVRGSGSVILINHQSALDLLILAKLWPALPNSTVIAKKEVLYMQPFASAAWLWGTIFIDRVRREDAQKALNKTGEIIRRKKARVLLFPEGTRNHTEKLLPFKKGAFHLAIASKCPIQPVVVNRYRFLGKHRFDNGHIRIKILPAIPTDNYTVENMEELMEKSYKAMSEQIDIITKEEDNKLKID